MKVSLKKMYLIILFNYLLYYLFYEKRLYFIARNIEYLSLIYLASLIEREICAHVRGRD